MARKVKSEDHEEAGNGSAPPSRLITEKAFAKLLKDLAASESRMSEAKGEMGSKVEQAIASHNVHKDALRVVRKYLKKDPTAASEFIAHLDHYWILAKLPESGADVAEAPAERGLQERSPSNVTRLRQDEDEGEAATA